ncbi:unnamed protein product, partial [Symbiodinium sp. KB8]
VREAWNKGRNALRNHADTGLRAEAGLEKGVKADFEEDDRASKIAFPANLEQVDKHLVTPLARPWDLEERDLLLVETLLDAVLLVLILYLILACMILAAKRADVAEGQSEFAHELGELQVLHCPLSTEVTEADVRAAVDDPFAWGQLLRFGWFVLRPLGNLALLIYTAATLARWQPHKPWDLERHIVICGKGLAAMVSLSLLLAFVLKSAVLSLSKFPDTLLATTAVCRLASSLSSLRLLTLADPVATWTWTKQVLMKNPGMIKLQAMPLPAVCSYWG